MYIKTINMKSMKRLFAVMALIVMAQSVDAQKTIKLENERDSASYALGVLLASQLKQTNIDTLNYDAMVKGLIDYFEEADTPKFTMDVANEVYRNYLEGIAKAESFKNKSEGDAFLAANAKKDGVQTTPSGLQYRVIEEGDGASPSKENKVTVHYTGKLIDGKVFDSSIERGQPASFGVTQVIPGWTEALQMMKVGSKWELVIPADLAYGSRGQGSIPPGSVLIFEVELISIESNDTPDMYQQR
jgi:FKBP-type peptidyl-prolyl cis-trans isomerase